MKLIKLTTTADQPIIFNWDNCVIHTTGGQSVQVTEDMSDIGHQLN